MPENRPERHKSLRYTANCTLQSRIVSKSLYGPLTAPLETRNQLYMRLLRGNVPLVLDEYDYKFELGKAKLLRDGADALIIASGFMTMRALETVEMLRAQRIDVGVLHVPTIKPLDEATIIREASKTGRLVIVA